MEALPKIEGEIMECAFYDLPEDTAITRVGWGEVRDAIAQARAEGAREALASLDYVLADLKKCGITGENEAEGTLWVTVTEPHGEQPHESLENAIDAQCQASFNDGKREGERSALAQVDVRLHPPVTAIKSLCEWGIYKAQPDSAVHDDCNAITEWLAACSREKIAEPTLPPHDATGTTHTETTHD